MMAAGLLMTGCGEMFEVNEDDPTAPQMKIDRTAIDIMVGDTYTINVMQQAADDVDLAVAWTSADPKIATFEGGDLKAVSPGHTTVTVEWLSKKLTASCVVNVYPKWEVSSNIYPYDMMVYADVTVAGRPMDQDCIVAAFNDAGDGEVICGVGQLLTEHGITYMAMRLFSQTSNGGDYVLRCYDRQRMLVTECEEELTFDSYSLGNLSDLYKIVFD